jgi:hypothetical protein
MAAITKIEKFEPAEVQTLLERLGFRTIAEAIAAVQDPAESATRKTRLPLASRAPPDDDQERYLPAPHVQARYSVSAMWLHRRLHDDSGFPRPDMVVRDRRYWKLSTIVRWERNRAAMAAQGAAAPSRGPRRKKPST